MALLYTKTRQTPTGSYETDLVSSSGKDWDAEFWLGNGIFSTGRRPCFINFRGDVFVAGAFSRVLTRPKVDRRMLPAGLTPVRQKIDCVEAGGSGGSTGLALCYVTLLHKEGGRVLAESDRSNVVDVGLVAGGGFDWSNLPTSNEDYRTTHIRGYRSMDGADYRKAWESAYGIPTYTENVLTQNLTVVGAAAGRNGVPPKGLHYMTDWGGRMFYARTAEHPYRLWWSAAGFPQYVNLGSDYVDTWDRAAITAIAKARNDLIVFTTRSAYLVRQFGQESLNDFVLIKLDNAVGCINHFGVVEIHNRLWFPSEDGFWIYDGGFRYLMRDMRPVFVADYKASNLAFQIGFGYDDRDEKTYVFQTRRNPVVDLGEKTDLTCGTICYVGTYESFEPSLGGGNPQPDWTFDVYGRENSAALYNLAGEVLIGSCDGIIRKHLATDPDDDGDTLLKELIIRHGHAIFMQPGDDIESGKTIADFWCYVEAEFNAWTLYLLGGDENAWNQVRPENEWGFWKLDTAASQRSYSATIAQVTKQLQALPQTVHYLGQPPKVSGRGLTVEIRAKSPVGMKYRGYGGAFEPGPAERPAELMSVFTLGVQWRYQGEGAADWREGPIVALVKQQTGVVNLEIRSYLTGIVLLTYPVALVLDFEGSNMPADDTDSIPSGTEVATAAQFTGMDTAEGSGTLEVTATGAGNLPAENGPVQFAVDVGTWDMEIQYQINGGGWLTYSGQINVTTSDTLEMRVGAFGSHFPTAIEFQFNVGGAGANPPDEEEDPVNAPGTYVSHVVSYPGGGFGTYIGQVRYYDGSIAGQVLLISQGFLVNWSS